MIASLTMDGPYTAHYTTYQPAPHTSAGSLIISQGTSSMILYFRSQAAALAFAAQVTHTVHEQLK